MGFAFYDWKKNAGGDFFGGLNAAIVAIPLAMAFGVESGLGAAAGLIGAFVLCSVASLVGGTPMLISGPTAPMTVVSSIIVASTLESTATLEEGLSTIFAIFFLAGAIQVLLGILRVGHYIRFAPYTLISGFLSGVGVLMILLQISPLLGEPSRMHVGAVISGLPEAISRTNLTALVLGLSTILIIYVFPRITKSVPSSLVALIGISLIAYFLPWKVPVIGDIPNEWMEWKWRHVQDIDHTVWREVLVPSFTLALIGTVDTLLTSLVADMMTRTQHRSNRELIGQGLGNMLSALTGGLPGSGATLRTVLNIRSGGKTRWSALFYSAFLLLVLLEVSRLISHIPLAVLAGILVTVGFNTIDYKGLRDIGRMSRTDAAVIVVVLIMTVFVGVLQAFACGIILASLFFVKKMADKNRTQSEPVRLVPDHEEEFSGLHASSISREVYIQEFSGPLFFGFASYFKKAFQELPYMRAVIFRMEHVPFIDHSGIVALGEVLQQLKAKEIIILLTGLREEPEDQLRKMDIIPGTVGEQRVFPTFSAGADWLVRYLKENPSPHFKEMAIQRDLGLDELNHRLN